MNILVTGANGQLGNEMRIVSKNSKDNYIFTDIIENEGFENIEKTVEKEMLYRDANND